MTVAALIGWWFDLALWRYAAAYAGISWALLIPAILLRGAVALRLTGFARRMDQVGDVLAIGLAALWVWRWFSG